MPCEGQGQQAPESVPISSVAQGHSDYVVYVDESGDHAMGRVDPAYPIFVLALCVVQKKHYCEVIAPALGWLKFCHFGHDHVVLHEHDIRKQKGAFGFLSQLPRRLEFMQQLSDLMSAIEFTVIACVVDKRRLPPGSSGRSNPYHLALDRCLASLRGFLEERQQHELLTHLVAECRGRREDADLELEFHRLGKQTRHPSALQIIFADKRCNLPGLQLADLVARPIGLNYLRPGQPNQAFAMIQARLRTCLSPFQVGAPVAVSQEADDALQKSERPR